MTRPRPVKAPQTDQEWALATEQRLRALESPHALRIGQWVITELEGKLLATRPGKWVELGTAEEEPIQGQSLLDRAVAQLQGKTDELETSTEETATGLDALKEAVAGVPIVGDDLVAVINRLQYLATATGLISDEGVPGLGNIIDTVFQTFMGGTSTGNTLPNMVTALLNIPDFAVLGVGGPASIGAALRSTWDQWISGSVGELGTGAGLSDLFNVAFDVSSWASLGRMGFDILGIRNNNPLTTGFLPTSKSNIGLDKLVLTPGTVAITQSTALTAYQIIEEAIDIGAVSWQGSGIVNVTDFYVNIYKMDPVTGSNSGALHASANQVGILSATMQQNIYSLPSPVHFGPGEILGAEFALRGAGTHTVLGAVSTLVDQAVYPRRWSSVRNSGTSAPPSTAWAPIYSNNVPFVEAGLTAGIVDIPHGAQTVTLSTVGVSTVPVPTWANFVDVIALGSGGGGGSGSLFGVQGGGGNAGSWATATWARGTHFSGPATISVTVPAGGAGHPGGSSSGTGSAGAPAVVSIPGSTVTAFGGSGGVYPSLTADKTGDSPGNKTYNDVVYAGGGTQNTGSADGAPAGGGGAGGNGYSVESGGDGAPGRDWIVFRQT